MKDVYEAIEKSKPQNMIEKLSPAKMAKEEKIQRFIEGLLNGETISNLAKKLDVNRTTLYTYFDEWLKKEQSAYCQLEWLSFYNQLKRDNPEKAFDGLTKLVSSLLKRNPEINIAVGVQQQTENTVVNIDAFTDSEREAILNARRLINQKLSSAPKPISLH